MYFNRLALEEFLRCHGITKAVLADQTGLSRGYISDLLNGNKKNPTRTSLKRIGQALGIDPRALYVELPGEVVRFMAKLDRVAVSA